MTTLRSRCLQENLLTLRHFREESGAPASLDVAGAGLPRFVYEGLYLFYNPDLWALQEKSMKILTIFKNNIIYLRKLH